MVVAGDEYAGAVAGAVPRRVATHIVAGVLPSLPGQRGIAAPVERHRPCTGLADDAVVAEAGDDLRTVALPETLQRRLIEMVIVIVADQNEVDARQIVKCDAGGGDTLRPEPQRAGAIGIDRVGQNVEAVGLDEDTGMADPGDDHAITLDAGGGLRRRHRHLRRPVRATVATGELAPEEAGATAARRHPHRVPVVVGIEEALAVVMIALAAAIIDPVQEAGHDRYRQPGRHDQQQQGSTEYLECERHGQPSILMQIGATSDA